MSRSRNSWDLRNVWIYLLTALASHGSVVTFCMSRVEQAMGQWLTGRPTACSSTESRTHIVIWGSNPLKESQFSKQIAAHARHVIFLFYGFLANKGLRVFCSTKLVNGLPQSSKCTEICWGAFSVLQTPSWKKERTKRKKGDWKVESGREEWRKGNGRTRKCKGCGKLNPHCEILRRLIHVQTAIAAAAAIVYSVWLHSYYIVHLTWENKIIRESAL